MRNVLTGRLERDKCTHTKCSFGDQKFNKIFNEEQDKLIDQEKSFENLMIFLKFIFKCVFRWGNMDLAHHGLVLLKRLNAQREFGFLCDCTVAIGDILFKAHKAVLAAFSNYFRMLFIHQDR